MLNIIILRANFICLILPRSLFITHRIVSAPYPRFLNPLAFYVGLWDPQAFLSYSRDQAETWALDGKLTRKGRSLDLSYLSFLLLDAVKRMLVTYSSSLIIRCASIFIPLVSLI